MTTDKELAAAYRLVADDYAETFGSRTALTGRADELDPPKPTWPAGTIAWVTDSIGIRRIAVRYCDEWLRGDDPDDANLVATHREVDKVEPLRVLGDDEIALSRDLFHGMAAKESRYKGSKFLDNSDCQRIFYAYADALDAEEGDRA